MNKLMLLAVAALSGCIGDLPADPGTPGTPTTQDPTPVPPTTTDPGTGSGSGSGSQPVPLTATTFVHTEDAATCMTAFLCQANAPDPTQFALMYGDTMAACPDTLDTYRRVASIAGGVTAGRILFNLTAANDCVANTTAPSTCAAFFSTGMIEPTTCIEALKGTVPDGENCAVSEDCLNDDSTCDTQINTCVAI